MITTIAVLKGVFMEIEILYLIKQLEPKEFMSLMASHEFNRLMIEITWSLSDISDNSVNTTLYKLSRNKIS